jgi:hypothetical protein
MQVRSTSSAETLLMNHIVPDLQLPVQLTAPVSAESLAGGASSKPLIPLADTRYVMAFVWLATGGAGH